MSVHGRDGMAHKTQSDHFGRFMCIARHGVTTVLCLCQAQPILQVFSIRGVFCCSSKAADSCCRKR